MRPLAGGRCGTRVMMGNVGLKTIKKKKSVTAEFALEFAHHIDLEAWGNFSRM